MPTASAGGLAAADPAVIERLRLPDGGQALANLLAVTKRENNKLQLHLADVRAKPKDANQFTFGNKADFEAGVHSLVGLPTGLNVQQWTESMRAEHEVVDPGRVESKTWGGSDRVDWTTGNYSLRTTPRKEWLWVFAGEWDGSKQTEIIGARDKGSGVEDALVCGGRFTPAKSHQYRRAEPRGCESTSRDATKPCFCAR